MVRHHDPMMMTAPQPATASASMDRPHRLHPAPSASPPPDAPPHPDADRHWAAVTARDAAHDGAFVYAVRSTGVYCRPSCPSRRPKRENVSFHPTPEAARIAGFRACRRCQPDLASEATPRVAAVREACRMIEAALAAGDGPVPMKTLTRRTGFSAAQLQRLFKGLLGVSARAYADALRRRAFRDRLRDGDSIAGALYESGYGSPSRVYEQAESHLGMTPASFRAGGAGAEIHYTTVPCALGHLAVAETARGICFVGLGDDADALAGEVRRDYPKAVLSRDDEGLARTVRTVLDAMAGEVPATSIPLDIRATAFQRKVWDALQRIPRGETRSYGEIAAEIGAPAAARAVGRACATNPVSILIPCHRVTREGGHLNGYRWGLDRKQALLRDESAGQSSSADVPE